MFLFFLPGGVCSLSFGIFDLFFRRVDHGEIAERGRSAGSGSKAGRWWSKCEEAGARPSGRTERKKEGESE